MWNLLCRSYQFVLLIRSVSLFRKPRLAWPKSSPSFSPSLLHESSTVAIILRQCVREDSLGLDLNLRLGPPSEIREGSSGNEDDNGGGLTVQSGVVVEFREESTVDKGSRSAPQVGEVSNAISPTERSSEGECDPKEGGEESWKEAKESSGITTASSRKADDHDEDEEAMVEVIKKEEDQKEKESQKEAKES